MLSRRFCDSPNGKQKFGVLQVMPDSSIPNSWLRYSATCAEFERKALERTAATFNIPLDKVVARFGSRPFGDMTQRWREFASKLEEEDELWWFSSPEGSFAAKCGCAGYAIVRGGVIRETLVMLRT